MLAISLIERRVNIIYYCLGELARINKKINVNLIELIEFELNKRESNKYLRLKFVFIRFNT
jgi:hypothetical protein